MLARPAACLGDRDKEEPRQGPEPACHTSSKFLPRAPLGVSSASPLRNPATSCPPPCGVGLGPTTLAQRAPTARHPRPLRPRTEWMRLNPFTVRGGSQGP